eukprot:49011-Eustigmatos_ZCMA.PRE.1
MARDRGGKRSGKPREDVGEFRSVYASVTPFAPRRHTRRNLYNPLTPGTSLSFTRFTSKGDALKDLHDMGNQLATTHTFP